MAPALERPGGQRRIGELVLSGKAERREDLRNVPRSEEIDVRPGPFGFLADRPPGIRMLDRRDGRSTRLENPRLVARDLVNRVAEELHMVEVDRRDHGNR